MKKQNEKKEGTKRKHTPLTRHHPAKAGSEWGRNILRCVACQTNIDTNPYVKLRLC